MSGPNVVKFFDLTDVQSFFFYDDWSPTLGGQKGPLALLLGLKATCYSWHPCQEEAELRLGSLFSKYLLARYPFAD